VNSRYTAEVTASKTEPTEHLTVSWNLPVDGLRNPFPLGYTAVNKYYGFTVEFLGGVNSFFENTLIHEARHVWQYELTMSGLHEDTEAPPGLGPGDWVMPDPPVGARELTDAEYGSEATMNPEFMYRGTSEFDSWTTVRSSFEMDAMRFAYKTLSDSLECSTHDRPLFYNAPASSPYQHQVLVQAVLTYPAQVPNTVDFLWGAPIQWEITSGDCYFDCAAITWPCWDQLAIVPVEEAPDLSRVAIRASSPTQCEMNIVALSPLNSQDLPDCSSVMHGTPESHTIEFQ